MTEAETEQFPVPKVDHKQSEDTDVAKYTLTGIIDLENSDFFTSLTEHLENERGYEVTKPQDSGEYFIVGKTEGGQVSVKLIRLSSRELLITTHGHGTKNNPGIVNHLENVMRSVVTCGNNWNEMRLPEIIEEYGENWDQEKYEKLISGKPLTQFFSKEDELSEHNPKDIGPQYPTEVLTEMTWAENGSLNAIAVEGALKKPGVLAVLEKYNSAGKKGQKPGGHSEVLNTILKSIHSEGIPARIVMSSHKETNYHYYIIAGDETDGRLIIDPYISDWITFSGTFVGSYKQLKGTVEMNNRQIKEGRSSILESFEEIWGDEVMVLPGLIR